MEGHLKKFQLNKYGAMLLEERNINPFLNDVFKAYRSLGDSYIPTAPEELLSRTSIF